MEKCINEQAKQLTPSAIKYLMATAQLCSAGEGARCVDVAARLNVSKPSAHAMIQNLCSLGLATKKRYGRVRLTPEGEAQAKLCEACYAPLYERMHAALALDEELCRSVALNVLSQSYERIDELAESLNTENTAYPMKEMYSL